MSDNYVTERSWPKKRKAKKTPSKVQWNSESEDDDLPVTLLSDNDITERSPPKKKEG